jgi:hypothetical protein
MRLIDIGTIEMIKEAASADQKLSICNLSLHLAVNINIAAFITNENKPKDKSIAGRVSSLTRDPISPFMRPNKKATQRYVLAPPITVIPEIKEVAAQKAKAPLTKRSSTLI